MVRINAFMAVKKEIAMGMKEISLNDVLITEHMDEMKIAGNIRTYR
jgi:hypothetical protein